MRLFACILALAPALAANRADEIMVRVAANQDRAEELRSRYVYRQTTAIRVRDSRNQLTREEVTNYEIVPTADNAGRKEASFTCKYREDKQLLPCEKSGEPVGNGLKKEIDAHISHNLRDDLTASKEGKDGFSPKLFPLTSKEQARYIFELKGEEVTKNVPVYRISFKPKRGEQVEDVSAWAGEALISREDYEPVQVATKLAQGIPFVVRTVLGTNLHGLGFTVTYSKFEDGVWFPVSYGAEFDLHVVFFYSRKISVSLTNSDFKKTSADTSVSFQ